MALDYLHIGASRAGSTWLYQQFVQLHPQIKTPNGKKYTAFWNQKTHSEFHRKRGSNNWDSCIRSLHWYTDLFKSNEEPGVRLADLTDGNSWIPRDTIAEIYSTYPDVRITYAIRNPLTTIWSHVVKHDKRVSPAANIDTMKKALTDPAYVYNTHYMENINRWMSVFPEEQVLIYFYTDLENPHALLKRLANHLEVDTAVWDNVPHEKLVGRVNASSEVAIREDVLAFLQDYYKEQIHQLSDFFDKDLSHWLEGKE